MSLHQYCEIVPYCPPHWLSVQFMEVFDRYPDSESQCKDLPCSDQYPGHLDQKSGVTPQGVTTCMGAGEDVLLWYSSHQPDTSTTLKSLIDYWSLPPETPLFCIALSTMQDIWIHRNITTRKMSNLRDCWYMACNRTITMAVHDLSVTSTPLVYGNWRAYHPAWNIR